MAGLEKAKTSLSLEFPDTSVPQLEELLEWFRRLCDGHRGFWDQIAAMATKGPPAFSDWPTLVPGEKPLSFRYWEAEWYVAAETSFREKMSECTPPWEVLSGMKEELRGPEGEQES